ncbi:FHA domain-containing protein, partial [bacterium]|nr:FHA domain-containing protein [bacterium]
ETSNIKLKFSDWQKIQSIHLILAKYARAIIDPDNFQS